jgi:hypothetical protein
MINNNNNNNNNNNTNSNNQLKIFNEWFIDLFLSISSTLLFALVYVKNVYSITSYPNELYGYLLTLVYILHSAYVKYKKIILRSN